MTPVTRRFRDGIVENCAYLHENSESSAGSAHGADNGYPGNLDAASVTKDQKLAM
jgi:hypothetical protein